MRIVVDENIPFAREAFGRLGEVVTLPGRSITSRALRDADALVVRSVTRVDRLLLEGTSVRFVATATIGTDHIDSEYLLRREIGFAYAPGCNATSVAEYVVAALLVLAHRRDWSLEGKSLGVVGVGNVGSQVVKRAEALGMTVLKNDPPLERHTGCAEFTSIDEILASDVITLHVPLTKEDPDKTFHMVDKGFLERMRDDAVLINTSRGAVVDGQALLLRRRGGAPAGLVLDVWENEPSIDVELLTLTDIASAHIAGYSLDGKVNGTFQVYSQACRFFDRPVRWDPSLDIPPPITPEIELLEETEDEALIARTVGRSYSIEEDDRLLRGLSGVAQARRGEFFDNLRKTYRTRREFHNTTVTVPARRPALSRKLEGIGFRVARV